MKRSRNNAFILRPIGRVGRGVIHIHKRWSKALSGIEGFSHVIVLFWLNEARKPEMRIHPKGIKQIPKIGYLATRTPHRANPIGETVVKLIRRKGTTLYVEGLDAWERTPVIDIKPYTKKDAVKKFRLPGWVKLLDQKESDPLRKFAS